MSFWQYVKQHIWNLILGAFVLAVIVYAVVTVIQDRDGDKPMAENQPPRSEIVDQFQPQGQASPQAEAPSTPPIAARGEPNVLGSTQPPPPAPTLQVTFKPYRNEALGFSASVPSDTLIRATANEVQALSGNQAGLYWTITVHPGTTETLDSLQHQLRNSPSITSLVPARVGGKAALKFTSTNLGNATGYALVTNGRLYYLIGSFANPILLDSFTFF